MEQDYIYIEKTTVKSNSAVQNVDIRIRSVVEGVENQWETTGEYKWDGRQHMLAYTDYTGNAITKNGIFADQEKMLLHRVGAITCDMLFDTLTATMVDYKAYMVGAKFLLHTETYAIEENENGLTIRVQYTLDDSSGNTPIVGEQEIAAVFKN